jgi:hypothetical protein
MKTQLSKASSQRASYTEEIQTGRVGVVAGLWPQRRQSSGRTRHPPSTTLSLGAGTRWPKSEHKPKRSVEELEAERIAEPLS